MGGGGQVIEADETFIGRKKGIPKAQGGAPHKCAVLTLINRDGEARSFHIEDTRARNIVPIVKANIAKEARLVTHEFASYVKIGKTFAQHERMNHAREERARGEVQHQHG